MKIQLYIDIRQPDELDLRLTFNNTLIDSLISLERNNNDHYCWEFNANAKENNLIKLSVTGLKESNYVDIVNCIIDGINYDIVHIMNCRTNTTHGSTRIKADGFIEIPFTTPVCLHWAKVFNDFDYKDYPHWTS